VSLHPLKLSYLDGLKQIASDRSGDEATLVLFLGSTIGNFHREDAISFFREVRRELVSGDALLLGADLDKSIAQLLPAYDDPAGVTGAFNLNLLGHINRVLGANFDLRSFAHEARFNQVERRIEMHLRSIRDQAIAIPGAELDIRMRRGETIWTESSYRYSLAELENLSKQAGFRQIATWVDEEWPFASALWIAR
jgi:L-histidine Nalpha-methyltransferase